MFGQCHRVWPWPSSQESLPATGGGGLGPKFQRASNGHVDMFRTLSGLLLHFRKVVLLDSGGTCTSGTSSSWEHVTAELHCRVSTDFLGEEAEAHHSFCRMMLRKPTVSYRGPKQLQPGVHMILPGRLIEAMAKVPTC